MIIPSSRETIQPSSGKTTAAGRIERQEADPTGDQPSSSFPAAPSSSSPHGRFIGRRRQLDILKKNLDRATAGDGNLVVLSGEAGVGKTRLAREFALRAEARGAIVLNGGCYEGEWRPAYGPWIEALRRYEWTAKRATERASLETAAGLLVKLVPELMGSPSGVPQEPPLSPDQERLRLYDGLTHFVLTLAATDPVVFLLDDLQWADADSLQLLQYLGRFIPTKPVMIVGIHREPELGLNPQHPLAKTLEIMRRDVEQQRVAVRGFGRHQLAEYLTEVAGRTVSAALVSDIFAQTQGNAFYAHEVVRHLVASASPAGVLDRSEALPAGGSRIPPGLRMAVHGRLSRLSADAIAVLQQAVAFTEGFELPVIEALTGMPEEPLLRAIEEAVGAGYLRVVSDHPPLYDFAHAIVRHALYDDLNPDRRMRLHRRVATALDGVYADRRLDRARELAAQYHLSAGLPGAAEGIPFALAAAEQARAKYAHAQAASYLRMAKDLSDEAPQATNATLLCRLAIAEADALMLKEAESSVAEALEVLARDPSDPDREAEFLADVARSLKDAGARAESWEPLVERGLILVGGRRDLTWARLELLRDRFETVGSGPVRAVRWSGADPEAIEIARSRGTEDDYVRTLQPASWRTYEETERVIKLLRSWKQPAAKMRALDVAIRDLVEIHYALSEAVVRLGELIELSEWCGAIPEQAEAHLQLAGTWMMLGDFAQAKLAAHKAHVLIARLGVTHRLQLTGHTLTLIRAYYLEEWEAALAAIQKLSGSIPEQERNPFTLAAAAGVTCIYARAGRDDEARHLLGALTPLAQQLEPTARGHNAVVAGAASAVWDLALAEYAAVYREVSLALIESGMGGGPLGPNELALARMAALLGNMPEADDYFARSRRIADDMGMGHVRGIVDHDEALALVRCGKTGDSRLPVLLRGARQRFRTYEMHGWEQRVVDLQTMVAGDSAGPKTSVRGRGRLTRRETQVLGLLADGMTNKEIAADLTLSRSTVERHIANIYTKIGVRGRAAATAYAFANGIAELPDV